MKEPIFISWKKNDENSILNYPTSERGILNIYNVQRSDAGKYICLGISRNTGITLFMKTVNLKVIGIRIFIYIFLNEIQKDKRN